MPGDVIQMKFDQSSVQHTITNTNNISDGNAKIQGLDITFVPKRSNSIIVLQANIHHTYSHVVSFGFRSNGVPVANLSPNDNSSGSNVTVYNGGYNPGHTAMTSWMITPTNPGAGQRMDISIGATASWSNNTSAYTLYINRRDSNDMASVSSMAVYEIAQ